MFGTGRAAAGESHAREHVQNMFVGEAGLPPGRYVRTCSNMFEHVRPRGVRTFANGPFALTGE
jgi:hypothetical protein